MEFIIAIVCAIASLWSFGDYLVTRHKGEADDIQLWIAIVFAALAVVSGIIVWTGGFR